MMGGLSLRRAFQRGGNWNNTTNAGVFALNLNNTPTNTNTNIGFRVARSFDAPPVAEFIQLLVAGMAVHYGCRQRAKRSPVWSVLAGYFDQTNMTVESGYCLWVVAFLGACGGVGDV